MDKLTLFLILPFSLLILLVGVVTMHARRGRPLRINLRGLGIAFELVSEEMSPSQAARILAASRRQKGI